ncbi:hypothetical protein [Stenotrophomonas sp. NLF4-10]|uniref:hypothetical protein n=1 Tax=Stenotrophomonas sp. NLF4-10 TaxID=2918754 RepID=UPI001EFB6229|nr:hypothetical protein [Stenotrophomonas sp. NLF4-10]MCG8277015.1 hypothetical protein [Stenotrophomonas sp. NLF4-10]
MKFTQCLALLLLTACNPEIAMNQEHAAAEADVANGGRGLAKLNPAPRKAYELTLQLKDAPGPFAVVSGVAQYDVVNEDQCGHIEPATGTASRITSQEDVVLHKVSDTEYRGMVYLDLMQDEDYYGRGMCRWEFTGAGVMLKATGAEGETRFLSFIEADRFMKGDVLTRYYVPRHYPRSEKLPDFGASGTEDPSKYRPELQGDLFTASLSGSEVQP